MGVSFCPSTNLKCGAPGSQYHGDMDEEPEDDEPIGLTEAELNAMRPLTLGERIVTRVMGRRPPCANCRK